MSCKTLMGLLSSTTSHPSSIKRLSSSSINSPVILEPTEFITVVFIFVLFSIVIHPSEMQTRCTLSVAYGDINWGRSRGCKRRSTLRPGAIGGERGIKCCPEAESLKWGCRQRSEGSFLWFSANSRERRLVAFQTAVLPLAGKMFRTRREMDCPSGEALSEE